MPTQPKPRKPGRPKLPKGHAKGKIVALRFSADDVKRVNAAAKAKRQTVSEWMRTAIDAAMAEGA